MSGAAWTVLREAWPILRDVVALLGIGLAAYASVRMRLAFASFELQLTKDQEARCAACEREKFAGSGEFEQLTQRVSHLEGRRSHA
ncbi:MAG: hypothetical protein LAQ30_01600 [Acidobacteriia bacterium]|nr:hypothetical protein [Terriglobia bacterium]